MLSTGSFAVHIADLDLDLDPLDPASVVEGSPQTWNRVVWESEDGRIIRGVWQISPGVVVDTEAHEMFVVIVGRATIAIDGGNTFDVGPGDMGVLEAGRPLHAGPCMRPCARPTRSCCPPRERRRVGGGGATPLLAGLAARPGPGRPVRGRGRLLAGRGRRRLHGPVGGAAGQAGRSRPRRRGAGGGDGGRGRKWPQRWLHRRVPDPWPAQRPQPVPRRDRSAGAAGAREPGRHRAGDRAARHRLRLGADRVDPGGPQSARGRGAERVRAGDAGARLRLRLARPR